jgi:putative transposase
MTDLFLLSQAQMRRIERYFPLSHGIARVDDRRIVSAIVFVIRNGLRWRDAPREYGPHKTIYNRFIRWSRLGVFNKIFAALARKGGKPERSPTYRAHQRRSELQAARGLRRSRTPARHALERGADERLQGRGVDVARHAQGQGASCRQGLRRRLVPRRPRQAPHRRLHPVEIQSEGRHPLAAHPHPIRPLPPHLLLGNLHRRSHRLLAVINES